MDKTIKEGDFVFCVINGNIEYGECLAIIDEVIAVLLNKNKSLAYIDLKHCFIEYNKADYHRRKMQVTISELGLKSYSILAGIALEKCSSE